MTTAAAPAASPRDPLYRGYRFPAEIISPAVWRYYRFHLSHRDVEELLAERGVQVSYEAIRLWCRRFGATFAAGLRDRRRRSADKWHLDEVQLKIKTEDQGAQVLAVAGSGSRRAGAGHPRPGAPEPGGGRALPPPRARWGGTCAPGGGHRQTRQLSTSAQAAPAADRAPPAQRPQQSGGELAPAGAEARRALQRFKSPAHAQRFLEPFSAVYNRFRPRRHLLPAEQYRQMRTERFHQWQEAARLQPVVCVA